MSPLASRHLGLDQVTASRSYRRIARNGPSVDLAILSLGAINVPIYTTQAVDQIEFILVTPGAGQYLFPVEKLFRHAVRVSSPRAGAHDLF